MTSTVKSRLEAPLTYYYSNLRWQDQSIFDTKLHDRHTPGLGFCCIMESGHYTSDGQNTDVLGSQICEFRIVDLL